MAIFKKNFILIIIIVLSFASGYIYKKYSSINVDDLRVAHTKVLLDNKQVDSQNQLGLATFDGAWVSIGDKEMVNKINSVHIACWLDRKECLVAQANIIPKDIFGPGFYNDIRYYEIIQWTGEGQIIAKSRSICEEQIINADIKTSTVTLVESKLQNSDKTLCAHTVDFMLKLDSLGW